MGLHSAFNKLDKSKVLLSYLLCSLRILTRWRVVFISMYLALIYRQNITVMQSLMVIVKECK